MKAIEYGAVGMKGIELRSGFGGGVARGVGHLATDGGLVSDAPTRPPWMERPPFDWSRACDYGVCNDWPLPRTPAAPQQPAGHCACDGTLEKKAPNLALALGFALLAALLGMPIIGLGLVLLSLLLPTHWLRQLGGR